MAGIQHRTDQEVDSPYRRRSGRSARRGNSAAVGSCGRREIREVLPIVEEDESGRRRACLLQNSGQGDAGGREKARKSNLPPAVTPEAPAPPAEGLPSRQRMQLRSSGGRS